MIDNYDSFTDNLVQYLGELGEDVRVVRNDELSVEQIRKLAPERIVISPGPGVPNQAGVTLEMIAKLGAQIPILGVCLGHQSIGQVFGGKVVRAREIMHGKTSLIHHTGKGVFAALPNPFVATRYHSLVVEKSSVPAVLEVTAWTQNADGDIDEIMGFRHKVLPIEGVQFIRVDPDRARSRAAAQLHRRAPSGAWHAVAIFNVVLPAKRAFIQSYAGSDGFPLARNDVALELAKELPGCPRRADNPPASPATYDRAPRDLPRRDG
jgi:anthranilate synthase component 2